MTADQIIEALKELPVPDRCKDYVRLRDDRPMLAYLDLSGLARPGIKKRREARIRKLARQAERVREGQLLTGLVDIMGRYEPPPKVRPIR